MLQPPRRGLSLGLSLSLSTAVILTIIMGGLTYYQKKVSLEIQLADRLDTLEESLAPLATQLNEAETLQEIKHISQQFHLAYDNDNHSGHEVILESNDGKVLYRSAEDPFNKDDDRYFKADIKVHLQKSGIGRARLTVLKDNAKYRRFVRQQWVFWGIHIAATILTIFIFVFPVVYFVVTRPIKRLLNAVKKMESGYWSGVTLTSGAWELRWLAWRFSNMVKEVHSTITQLYDAERKALQLLYEYEHEHEQYPDLQKASLFSQGNKHNLQEVVKMLEQICTRLEHGSADDPESVEIAKQAKRQHALVADQLNFWNYKIRIENAALKITEPEIFARLNVEVLQRKEQFASIMETNKNTLRKTLEAKGIPCVMLTSRMKHTAGVWNKMKLKNLTLDEVNDLFALRIVVPTETDCYAALGLVHNLFRPLISRFKDYIAAPKPNGYQSLHTSVQGTTDFFFEVQIRSVSMHRHAEDGDAAHWQYKQYDREKGFDSGRGLSPI